MTLRGFKDSAEGVTTDVVELAWELELKVEPEGVTSLLQSHDKTWMDEEFILMDGQRVISEDGIYPGEDAVKLLEVTTKD